MRLSVIAMLAAAPFILNGCDRDRDRIGTTEQGAVDANEIAKRPDQFYGRAVTVVAEVEQRYGPNAFTLDEDAALAGPDVLVLVPKATRAVEENREVMVQGTVRPFVIAELQRDYAWFNPTGYDQQLMTRFKDRPVIIADMVRDQERGDLIAGVARRPAPAAENPPPAQ